MPDQANLVYTGGTITLNVLNVYGTSEPDRVSRFGKTHDMLDGSLAEQILGGRREITIDFNVMTFIQRRQVVDWWLDSARTLDSTAAAPGSVSVAMDAIGGSLTEGSTYLYKIAACDVIGESAASNQVSSGVVDATHKSAYLEWTGASGNRFYKVYRKKDAEAWKVLTITTITSYNDDGTVTPYKTATPLGAASAISVVCEDELSFEWGFGTELNRMLTLNLKETTIFLKADGFKV